MTKEKKNIKDRLGDIADKVKNQTEQAPIQKVVPVSDDSTLAVNKKKKENGYDPDKDKRLNVWLPPELMKKLKERGVKIEKSVRELVITALESYLETDE